MKAYISLSLNKRKDLEQELVAIRDTFRFHHIEPLVFIDQYRFGKNEEQAMMHQAMLEIDSSSILFAEATEKAVGVGIEAGYAKAKKIQVIYARNKNAEHSTTLSGISDFRILYQDEEDLKIQLSQIIKAILNASKDV